VEVQIPSEPGADWNDVHQLQRLHQLQRSRSVA
jgi:hypothetical protein